MQLRCRNQFQAKDDRDLFHIGVTKRSDGETRSAMAASARLFGWPVQEWRIQSTLSRGER